jgi:hypothetical protein
MSQPVKISEDLVLDARILGPIAKRSIASQIEFWAQLGRAIEPLLEGAQAYALQKAGQAKPLSACLRSVDSLLGRRRVSDYLHGQPFPHYRPAPHKQGMIVRIEANGKRTIGRFIGRRFKAVR